MFVNWTEKESKNVTIKTLAYHIMFKIILALTEINAILSLAFRSIIKY